MSSEDSAEEKFWNTPELLETLLPFLDTASTFNLAQSHFSSKKDSLLLGVLQRPLVWKRLIERALPKSQNDSWECQSNMLQAKKGTVVFLTEILKMFKDPASLEIFLLLLICKGFPPSRVDFYSKPQLVHVSHHLPPDQFETHSVSLQGFILLEMVESALDTTYQKIEKIQVSSLEDSVLMAISERASRQSRRVSELNSGGVACYTRESTEALFTLVGRCKSWEMRHLEVGGEVGLDGWNALRRAVCSPGAVHPLDSVRAPLRSMVEGRKEDLRAIWEVLGDVWSIQDTEHGGNHYICKGPPDEEDYNKMGWERLELFVDLEKKDIEKEDMERENMEKGNVEKEDIEEEDMKKEYVEDFCLSLLDE